MKTQEVGRTGSPALDFVEVGSGDELVCLLHPLGMDRDFWQWFTAERPDGWRYLLIDLPGHGRASTPSEPYTCEQVAHAVADVVRGLVPQRVHVVGASMGGSIAIPLVHELAEQSTGALILADTTARYSSKLREMWGRRAERARSQGMSALMDDLLDVWFTADAAAHAPEQLRYGQMSLENADPEAYAMACDMLAELDVEGLAEGITNPTFVVAGEDDVLADDARRLARTIPVARYVEIPGGRHGTPIERADAFNPLVRDFLMSSIHAQ